MEIDLKITTECNWNCEYCIVDTHNLPRRSFKEVIDKVYTIPKGSLVTLTGGEPGLMTPRELTIILDLLEDRLCEVRVNTNGLMFRYKNLINRFKSVFYHCSENLDTNKRIENEFANVPITYMIVVTDNNVDKLEQFLNYNKHIIFMVQGAVDNGNGIELSYFNRLKVWTKFKDVIQPSSKKYLLNKCTDLAYDEGLVTI